MPTSSIPDWPALESEVIRLAANLARQKTLNARIDAATAAVLARFDTELRDLSDLGAIEAAIRSNIEAFCREHHDEIVSPEGKTRELAGGHAVAFADNPPSIKLARKATIAGVCRAICRRGRELLGWLKKPKPDIDRTAILKAAREAADEKDFRKRLAALGLELHQEERFELRIAG